MSCYKYCGPVMEFERCINNKWEGYTNASTPERARVNLAYQYKKKNNRESFVKIILPGKITLVE